MMANGKSDQNPDIKLAGSGVVVSFASIESLLEDCIDIELPSPVYGERPEVRVPFLLSTGVTCPLFNRVVVTPKLHQLWIKTPLSLSIGVTYFVSST
jgi:hypothetical protein